MINSTQTQRPISELSILQVALESDSVIFLSHLLANTKKWQRRKDKPVKQGAALERWLIMRVFRKDPVTVGSVPCLSSG